MKAKSLYFVLVLVISLITASSVLADAPDAPAGYENIRHYHELIGIGS